MKIMKVFIKAKPGAKAAYVKRIGGDELFGKKEDNHFIVAVKERAVENKANRAIEKALAEYFKVPASRVKIVGGQTSREKIVEIA
jgi:uncharacterized protein